MASSPPPDQSEATALLGISADKINEVDSTGQTPLHRAIILNFSEAHVAQLLALGAHVNDCDEERRTALHHAVEGGARGLVRFLLSVEGISLEGTDVLNRTPLHVAVEINDTKIVKMILDSEKGHVGVKDLEGSTPLHVAALRNSLECCIALMEHGAQIHMADRNGNTPNSIWPVLEEIQTRLVEGCFHSISLSDLEEEKYLSSFRALGTLVRNEETHQKVLETFFLSNEGKERFCQFLSTGSVRIMTEIYKTFGVLLAGDQQNHFVKGTFVKIILAALENPHPAQISCTFAFLETLFEKDEQGDLLKRFSNSPVDVFLKLLGSKEIDVLLATALLISKMARYGNVQADIVKKQGLTLLSGLFLRYHLSEKPKDVQIATLCVQSLANISENEETHQALVDLNITADALPRHLNKQPPDPLQFDCARFLVNLGLDEKLTTNVYDFVDLDLEETTTDPLDRRDSSQSPSKEFTNKLEVPPVTREYPSSPSKELFRRKMQQDPVNVRESSSSVEESPGLLTPQLGVSRTPSSQSLGKVIPRGGYLVNLLKYLVIHGDQDVLDCFLLTYRTMMSGLVVLRNLIHLFKRRPPPNATIAEREEVLTGKERVLFVLVRWLHRHLEDFKEEPMLASLTNLSAKYSKNYPTAFWDQIARLLKGEPLYPRVQHSGLCNHNAVYKRARDAVYHRFLPVLEDEAVTLAAIQFQVENQIEKHEYTEEVLTISRFEPATLKGLLPAQYLLAKNVGQRIFDAHTSLNLKGLLEKDAKHLYIKTCKGLRTYGYKFFEVKYTEGTKKKVFDRLLGVGPSGMLILDDKTAEIVFEWPLPQIISWGCSSTFIFLRISQSNNPNVVMEYHFGTNRVEEINRSLTSHAKNFSQNKVQVDADAAFDLNESPRCPPDPLLGNLSAKTSSTTAIMSKFDGKQLITIAEELSRQMCLLEQSYFKKISLVDCIDYSLKRNMTGPGVETVKKLIRHFNMVSDWVSSELVQEEDDQERLRILRNFIQLARMCRKHNNFNGLMEILSGLNSSAVRKLQETWNVLPKKDLLAYEELDALLISKGNFSEYRKTLAESPAPTLPYFGVFLTDITFTEDGNSDYISGGRINFAKRWKLFSVVYEIERFQTQEYILQEIPEIKNFLETIKSLDENERYGLAKRLFDLKKAANSIKRSSGSKFTQTVSGLFKAM